MMSWLRNAFILLALSEDNSNTPGHWWFPSQKASNADRLCFLYEQAVEQASDLVLRRHYVHVTSL